MILPKYIEKAIKRRAKLAEDLMHEDTKISNWIVSKKIPSQHIFLDASIIGEPHTTAENTIRDIENFEELNEMEESLNEKL